MNMDRNKRQKSERNRIGLISKSAIVVESVTYLSLFLCIFLFACSDKRQSVSGTPSAKFEQYYVQGEQLYAKNCSNCHQKNGTGLGLLYPPLDNSDYMQNNFEEVICLLRHGTKGELVVNGNSYNKEMPGIPALTDLEIAEIATFIYNSWSHEHGIVDVSDVSGILATCEQAD